MSTWRDLAGTVATVFKIGLNKASLDAGALTAPRTFALPDAAGTVALLESPAFTGNPTAPTATTTDSDTSLATTAFAHNVVKSVGLDGAATSMGLLDLNSAVMGSFITVNGTADDGLTLNWPSNGNTGTTAQWWNVLTYGVSARTTQIASFGFNFAPGGRTLIRVRHDTTWTAWRDLAYTDSPAFTGNPTAPTAARFDADTSLATTAYVMAMGFNSPNAGAYTGTATLTANDFGRTAYFSHATVPGTLTLPSPAGVPVGSIISIANVNAAPCTVARATGAIYALGGLGGFGTLNVVLQYGDFVTLYSTGGNFIQVAGGRITDEHAAIAAGATTPNPGTAGRKIWSTSESRTLTWNGTTWDAGAALNSPVFTGDPKAPTPVQFDNDTSLATTAYAMGIGLRSNGSSGYTTSDTLTLADIGRAIFYNSASAGTLTLPSSGIPLGGCIAFSCIGDGELTVARAGTPTIFAMGGVSLTSIVLKKGESLVLWFTSANWLQLSGNRLTNEHLAVSAGATTPNPGVAGRQIWSTTELKTLTWNGSSWTAPATGGGGALTKGTATLDFGAGADAAQVTVLTSAVLSDSFILVALNGAGTVDNDTDEHLAEEAYPKVTNRVPGVSFDISMASADKFNLNGTWSVNWVIT